jgi:hypothetical protein
MKDNFDEDLRNKYLGEYDVDIENMNVAELLQKGKTSTKKKKLIYNRAALEKEIQSEKKNYSATTLRRANMKALLANFNKTGSMQSVWKGYLIHINDNVELPVEFEKRIKDEMIEIAKRYVGENNELFSSSQKDRFEKYNQVLCRGQILLELIDVARVEGINTAFGTIGEKYKGFPKSLAKPNPSLSNTQHLDAIDGKDSSESVINDSTKEEKEDSVRSLYYEFLNNKRIRPPKK